MMDFIKNIKQLDNIALEEAKNRQKSLIKPMGSLGVLEDISIRMAGITGKVKNKADRRILFLFASDNGIYEEGVAASPQHFTRTLMKNYADDKKCAINVICDECKVDLKLIDIGIKGGLIHPKVDNQNLMINGTNNFLKTNAIPMDILKKAINIGFSYAKFAKDNHYAIVGNGEVGMGNTTTATACIMAATGNTDADVAVGRGAGLNDEGFKRKKDVISQALNIYNFDKMDAYKILSSVGGLDIAAMVGLYLGCAYYRLPIVIDGLISVSAALLAYRIESKAKEFMFASHISEEPAYSFAIKDIGLTPILALAMRLGEGSGCPIAMKVIDTSIAIMNNMSTFSELSIEEEYRKEIKMK